MATYEITAEMNLKKIIDESREVAQALNEFADNLEQIKKKYAEPKYCDRNICIKNEYNGIGCDECEVTKSQEPKIGNLVENLCDSCTNKTCEFQSGIQRSKCDFYIAPMPHLEPDNCGNYVVQQEPKTGHWIEDNQSDSRICSICGRALPLIPRKDYFCPNCGARMESEE